MGKAIKKTINLKDIHFDEDLYPRSGFSWQTAYDYSESMKAGSKFPPITLAMLNKKLYLVDGKHRIEACKNIKKNEIEAYVYKGWSRKKIFKEAVKANISHGRSLSPYEKRKVAVKLMEMNCSQSEVSGLIHVPQEKLQNFVGKNLINSVTGERIKPEENEEQNRELIQARAGEQGIVLKSPLRHLSGKEYSQQEVDNIESVQKGWNSDRQTRILQEAIDLIENDFLDTSNKKVVELYEKLTNLIIQRG